MNSKNKKWLIFTGVILLVCFLNPTATDFKNYTGAKNNYSFKRTMNFLVCSVYESDGERYFGFLKNFIHLQSNHVDSNPQDVGADSTRVDNNSSQKEINDWNEIENRRIKACTTEEAMRNFREYMKFYYPDWKIFSEPVIKDGDDCTFKIQFTTKNPHLSYGEKEVMIAKLSYSDNYKKFSVNIIRGVIY